jgi:FkbM family methyltransferase
VHFSAWWYRRFPRLVFNLRRICGASYEREMELLDVLCDPERTGIDVGAKVGMYTYRIRDRSSDVIAFEPVPLFHDMLRTVFDGKRGRVEPVAASNRRGTATLRLPYDGDGHRQFGRSSIEPANRLEHHQIARTDEIEVETRTIDEYELPAVGFIKIDVEGHELAVLEGATRTIAAHRPSLLVESNDDHHPGAVASLAAWLREHDYEACFLDQGQLHDIARFDRVAHWSGRTERGVENFICTHRSREDLRARLARRVGEL